MSLMPKSLYFDRYLFTAMSLLCLISLVFLFRFDQIEGIKYAGQLSQSFLLRQSINILVGVLFFFLFWQMDLGAFKKISLYLFAISLLMVALTYFFGSHVMGAKRFIHLGLFSFQPSEIVKFTFILFLSALYADRKHRIENAFQLIGYLVALAIPFALVFKQPDLGTAVVFIAIFLGLSYKADVPPKLFFLISSPLISMLAIHMLPFPELLSWIVYGFFLLVYLIFTRINWIEKVFFFFINVAAGLSSPYLWNSLHGYQKQRLLSFLNPEIDPLAQGIRYHAMQSMTAIGSGGFFGKGFFQGPLSALGFIPEQHTDFIFSLLGEEMGFIGLVFVLVLFAIILYRILKLAGEINRLPFESLVLFGIASYLGFQMIVNVGMCLGILPVVGIPLPFVSFGGNAMVLNFCLMGIVQNIYYQRHLSGY